MKNNVISIVFSLLITVVSFFALRAVAQNPQYLSGMDALNTSTELISNQLSNAFTYVDIIELSVQFDEGNFSEQQFDDLTNTAIENNPCIANFQLAPGAVVSYINPLEGNEAALGRDLINDEHNADSVQATIDSNTILTHGPIEVNGGLYLYAGKSIRIHDEFWGLVIVVIDFEKLMTDSGLEDGYSLAVADSDGSYTCVWGSQANIDNSAVRTDVTLPDQSWRIAANEISSPLALLLNYGLAALASLLIGFAAYIVMSSYLRNIYRARHDILSNTLERSEFERLVQRELQRRSSSPGSSQEGQVSALLVVDINNFKNINDTYGHPVGDATLTQTGRRIAHIIKNSDLVSRIGGDEFCVFLKNIENKEQVHAIIDRIADSLADPVVNDDLVLPISLSIGYAIAPDEGDNFLNLYRLADARMYEIKRQSRP